MAEFSIPKISNAKITELLTRIHPCVRNGDKLHFIEPLDPRKVAFTWDPKLAGDAPKMPVLRKIRTLHTYGYYGFFKPSIAEVLAQIPADVLPQVVAFETHGPETADDLNRERETLNAGFHVAETTLYGANPGQVIRTGPMTAWDRVLGEDEIGA